MQIRDGGTGRCLFTLVLCVMADAAAVREVAGLVRATAPGKSLGLGETNEITRCTLPFVPQFASEYTGGDMACGAFETHEAVGHVG